MPNNTGINFAFDIGRVLLVFKNVIYPNKRLCAPREYLSHKFFVASIIAYLEEDPLCYSAKGHIKVSLLSTKSNHRFPS